MSWSILTEKQFEADYKKKEIRYDTIFLLKTEKEQNEYRNLIDSFQPWKFYQYYDSTTNTFQKIFWNSTSINKVYFVSNDSTHSIHPSSALWKEYEVKQYQNYIKDAYDNQRHSEIIKLLMVLELGIKHLVHQKDKTEVIEFANQIDKKENLK